MKEEVVRSRGVRRHFRHEALVTYLFMILLIGGGITLLYFFGGKLTGFATFSQSLQVDFDNGIYYNTEWNGSAVVLSGNNLSGAYTSEVFDAGADAIWNNLSYSGNAPDVEFLFIVDSQADFWSSGDGGITWALAKDDYNNGDGNGATDLEKNSTHLILLYNQDLWISSNLGGSWTKINDDYNGGEGQNGDVLGIDSNNYIYIIEGDQDVWRSVDGGISFSKLIANFNGGNGVVLGLVINSTGAIFAVDVHADVWVSLDQATSWTLAKDDYNGAIGNNVDDLAIDSNDDIYIVDRQDFWKSTDNGVIWTLANDDINGAGDSNDGLVAYADQSNNVYILDGSEDVLKSTDGGTTFTKVNSTDFNGGNGNVFGMNSFFDSTNLSFQVRNCSVSDCSDGTWQSVDLTNINLQSQYFQYRANLTSPDSSASPFFESVFLDYDLVNTAPSLSLVSPSEGDTYGDNESLSLTYFVVDADDNLDSCWYDVEGINVTITNCANTTFDVSGSGDYTLRLFANDSLGELSVDSASFSVALGAPSISISYPYNVYLNSGNNILFNYTPTDIDLESCQLWGNFSGTWSPNQTDFSPSNGNVNSFSLSLSDEFYGWNVWCNDSTGSSTFNGNKTFTVDSTNPSVSIAQPKGTKTSRTGVTFEFSAVDANLDVCWYNVKRGDTTEISNTTTDCGSSATFDVTVDADFTVNLFVNDSAGNFNSTSSNFTVDTSTTTVVSSDGGVGNSGGSGYFVSPINAKLDVGSLQNIVITEGGVKRVLRWSVGNAGISFLNNCDFESTGDYSDWISHSEIKGLAAGETYTFVFDVNIPESAEKGEYILGVVLICDEINKSSEFKVEVTGKQLDFKLTNVERVDAGNVSVNYTIRDLVGVDQSVELQFLIFDLDNKKEAEVNEIKFISAGSETEFKTNIPIRENLNGELSLLVNLNSESYSSFVQENIVLGSPATGFSVFGGEGARNGLVSAAIIAVFLVFAVFMILRIKRHKKSGRKN